MKVSFEDIGQVLATCEAEESVVEGCVVKVCGNGVVGGCAAGEKFCGVAVKTSGDGYAAVQVKGFVSVPCADSSVAAGWAELAADGDGGVKKAADGAGVHTLVMCVEDGKAVLCL